mmetsp:Transcript_2511/g.9207  ORF Transcript_2511/g.9207 Transcript_2511/m.9207 type:complete len:352 (+) Transcript_2511:1562-2617(+)
MNLQVVHTNQFSRVRARPAKRALFLLVRPVEYAGPAEHVTAGRAGRVLNAGEAQRALHFVLLPRLGRGLCGLSLRVVELQVVLATCRRTPRSLRPCRGVPPLHELDKLCEDQKPAQHPVVRFALLLAYLVVGQERDATKPVRELREEPVQEEEHQARPLRRAEHSVQRRRQLMRPQSRQEPPPQQVPKGLVRRGDHGHDSRARAVQLFRRVRQPYLEEDEEPEPEVGRRGASGVQRRQQVAILLAERLLPRVAGQGFVADLHDGLSLRLVLRRVRRPEQRGDHPFDLVEQELRISLVLLQTAKDLAARTRRKEGRRPLHCLWLPSAGAGAGARAHRCLMAPRCSRAPPSNP